MGKYELLDERSGKYALFRNELYAAFDLVLETL